MRLTDEILEQYLDEALPPDKEAEVERQVRARRDVQDRLAEVLERRDQARMTLGGIWRRHRLGCPSREVLGSYLVEALSVGWRDYVAFHLAVAQCPYCQASLEDLKRRRAESRHVRRDRQQRLFQSSRGFLRGS